MTRTARKLLLVNGTLGAVLTLAVALFDWAGRLEALERWFYDRRARDCQFFRPPPSGRIVHVDIDEAALDVIGKWPWPRGTLAQVIEEIAAAGPKVIALDIRLPEPDLGVSPYQVEEAVQPIDADTALARELRKFAPGLVSLLLGLGDARPDEASHPVDNDTALVRVMRKFGRVLVPLSLGFDDRPPDTTTERAMREILHEDLGLTPDQVTGRLADRGITNLPAAEAFTTAFVAQRTRAMFDRINAVLAASPDVPLDDLRKQLLPKADPFVTSSPLLRLLAKLHDKARRERATPRFSRAVTPDMPPLYEALDVEAPRAPFSDAAIASGFVDYIKQDDGKVRAIPLFARHGDRVYPQIGLTVACAMLGVDPNDVRIEHSRLVIPRKDGAQTVIPVAVREQAGTGKQVGALFDIPFFGTDDWRTMYDYPAHRAFNNHVPVNAVWQIIQTRQAIASNNATADRALFNPKPPPQVNLLTDYLGEGRAKKYAARRLDPEDAPARDEVIHEILAITGRYRLLNAVRDARETAAGLLGLTQDQPESERDRRGDAEMNFDHDGLRAVATENQRLLAQLTRQRDDLQDKLGGRAVLVGSVAGGMIYDFVPTTLHDKCPGVVVHGVIADSILTGKVLRRPPRWILPLITTLMGLATTAFVCFLRPTRAALAALGLLAAYFVLNGILLYDYAGLIVGVAGPIVAMLLAWLSCQLVEILVEKAERRRITRRFSSYVDPALVDFVIEHPEADVTRGREREMTVVFTDLAGFTTISEALKEGVIPLLNDYLGLMSSIITKHRGLVNKFLGDGIMFFYNAPRDNPNHAADAVETVLEMQEALIPFNDDLVKRGLPKITMRAGIATGSMVVGDAGGQERSDYTVIGDNVNLAARLESANKATDTKLMMTARTCELLNGQFLYRPTARLTVKGKTQGVDTCEVLCRTADATDDQRRMAELGKAVFDAFVAADFAACLRAVDELESEFGKTKLTKAYHELCEQYLKSPPGPDFGGEIVLSEK